MKDIKCPECSLSNSVEEGVEKFKCRFCGHEFEPRTAETADDGPTEETVLMPDAGETPEDGLTQETVLVSNEGKGKTAAAAKKSTADSKPSDALEPIRSNEETDEAPDPPAPLSSRMGLAELGISESDMPEFDPDTGRFHVDGRELTEGTRVFVYNDQGEPAFGYMLVEGSLVVSPEEGVRAAPPAEEPEEAPEEAATEVEEAVTEEEPEAKEEAAVEEAEKKPKVRKKKERPAGTSTSARRARAAAKAATDLKKRKTPGRRPRGKGEPKPKSAASMFATVMFGLSTLACLGFLAWWAFVGKNQLGGNGSENGKTMTFEPQDFTSLEMDVGESVAVCQERLEDAGWEIVRPSSNAQWALRQSGCIDSGPMDGGQIRRTRKGARGFRVSFDAGVLKLAGSKPKEHGNLSVLLEAPQTRWNIYFGFGPGLVREEDGKEFNTSFVAIYQGTKKKDERRHNLPIKLKYNTWYQLKIEARGGYLNFYFNGMKVDGIEMKAKEIGKVSIRAVAARAMVRRFSLVEDGVRPEPKPEPTKE